MNACEEEKTERTAADYYQLYNDDQFETIYEETTEGSKNLFTETHTVSELKALKAKYGRVLNRSLRGVNVEPSDEKACESAVNAQYTLEAEKGRFVEWIRWHIVDGETKMARRMLLEFDEKGKLYLTLRLHTGLEENDIQETKIQVEK